MPIIFTYWQFLLTLCEHGLIINARIINVQTPPLIKKVIKAPDIKYSTVACKCFTANMSIVFLLCLSRLITIMGQWAYSTGQVPSHTFLLIGRFLQFCIRLVPEMKPCEIRKNGRWTQRYCVSNVSTTIITCDQSAPVLLKLHYPAIHTNYSVWNCSILN